MNVYIEDLNKRRVQEEQTEEEIDVIEPFTYSIPKESTQFSGVPAKKPYDFTFPEVTDEAKNNKEFQQWQEEKEKQKARKEKIKRTAYSIWKWIIAFISLIWTKFRYYTYLNREKVSEEYMFIIKFRQIRQDKRKWVPPLLYSLITLFIIYMIYPHMIDLIRSFRNTIYTDSMYRSVLKPFEFENSSQTWSIQYDVYEEKIYSWNANQNKDKKLNLNKKEMDQGYFTTEIYKEQSSWNVSLELLKFKMDSITDVNSCTSSLQLGIPYNLIYIKITEKETFFMANPEIEAFSPVLFHTNFKFKIDTNSERIVYSRDIPDTLRLKWIDPLFFPLSSQSRTFGEKISDCLWIVSLKTV